ncbi:MAG: VWA domain-containing protein [Planctomycetota bacterium]
MPLPGGPLANRLLLLVYILDGSGSMAGSKIAALNHAIRESLAALSQAASQNPNAAIQIIAVVFSSGARWLVSQPTALASFKWNDLQAGGSTDMGQALSMVAEQLQVSRIGTRALPPVLICVSDGHPTDDAEAGLKAILNEPWGKKAVKISIGIGADCDYDILQKFMDNPERSPLQANNAADLVKYFVWASTEAVKAVSQPASQSRNAAANANVPLPIPPAPTTGTVSTSQVW